jgi:hypothetical protein
MVISAVSLALRPGGGKAGGRCGSHVVTCGGGLKALSLEKPKPVFGQDHAGKIKQSDSTN